MVHNYRVCQRSCFQRMCEITHFINRLGGPDKVGASLVGEIYKKNLKSMVQGPGEVTCNFVDTCKSMEVQKLILNDKVMFGSFRNLDDRAAYRKDALDGHVCKTPFEGQACLQAIIGRMKSVDKIEHARPEAFAWCIHAICYLT